MDNMYYEQESGKWYLDLDGIRIVHEADLTGLVKPVGWYRPDGWEAENKEQNRRINEA